MAAAEHPRAPRSGRPSDTDASTPPESPESATSPANLEASPPSVVVRAGGLVVRIGSRPDQEEVSEILRELDTLSRQAEIQRRPVDEICCDAESATDPDIGTIDALARVALAAQRLGRPLSIAGASPDLARLIALAGLGRILPLGVELERHAEEREEPRRVEEEGDPGDLAV
jgi:hypothetical protein